MIILSLFILAQVSLAQTPTTEGIPPALAQSAKPEGTTVIPKKFDWFGDFRYRLAENKEADDQARLYQQIRVRVGLKAEVNEDITAQVRLATGTTAISANQALGDNSAPGMPRRNFGLDQAYVDWNYASSGEVWAGRFGNPFWAPNKIQFLYDADLAFEGVVTKLNFRRDRLSFFANVGGFIINEAYTKPTVTAPGTDVVDAGMVGGDAGVILKGDKWTWTSHLGSYNFINIKGKLITALDSSAKVDVKSEPFDRYVGNSVVPEGASHTFDKGYTLLQVGSEWKHKVLESKLEYVVFGDFIQNTATSKFNQAMEYGAGLKWRRYSLGAAQIIKQSDSMLGAFTDSDTNGGGTDNRGTRLQFAAEVAKSTTITLSYFRATRGMDAMSRPFRMTFLDLFFVF